jgi:glutamine synthetase
MLGSAFSVAGPNIVLNTAVAEILREFADMLETSEDFTGDLTKLIQDTIHEHKRIIFNGNNYSDEWVQEAKSRGLSNLKTTVDALPAFVAPKSIDVFTKHHVFTETEIHSRYEILLENYSKTLHIEALTIIDMVKKGIVPACISYQGEVMQLLNSKKAYGSFECTLEEQLVGKLSKLSSCLVKKLEALEATLLEAKTQGDALSLARFYRDRVFGSMSELRLIIDELETLVAKKYWPYPTYAEILYSVN